MNFLSLNWNKIVDVNPLAGLSDLTDLQIVDNQIVDVKPLAKLSKLTRLWLGGNKITVKGCPVKPESICQF